MARVLNPMYTRMDKGPPCQMCPFTSERKQGKVKTTVQPNGPVCHPTQETYFFLPESRPKIERREKECRSGGCASDTEGHFLDFRKCTFFDTLR
ncbi:hypothetical protein AVEN_122423-1 [Araneus ventricosus]|uniref:Uncharacterized protein n=1 Tax=Araneus ventricosus TaxID=182803 RepID=A0A4Y2M354_ARAVE|nr:hypothetical protein AVEN_98649-1 [Araneus ventricosus]GBN21463.1 hypothetical protein AVEN_275390-1 [Araneus ventricosus]GBN21465.1 hypothetical protein AVEN_122423-1 [Araneus ventricosus]